MCNGISSKSLYLKTRQDDLFNSGHFYKTYRLDLHRQLNTIQPRNKRENVTRNRQRVGIIQIAKANLVDDPYNKQQLQTELRIAFLF